jgi:protein TonB
MYVMEYSKQQRAAPAAIAIVVQLALVYVFAVGLRVVPSPLPLDNIHIVDVPPAETKPVPIDSIPDKPATEKNDSERYVLVKDPVIKIEDKRDPLIDSTEGPIDTGRKLIIEEPVTVTSAHIVHSLEPTYPLVSRAREEEGTVFVKVMISPYGTVSDAQIEKSSGYSRLDAAALKSVRDWQFAAGKRGSQAIATWVTVSVKFVLHGRG